MRSDQCARPDCASEADAWLTYDYAARRVWLDDHPLAAGTQWGLCEAHAARLQVPMGWSEIDRRAGRSEPPASLVS